MGLMVGPQQSPQTVYLPWVLAHSIRSILSPGDTAQLGSSNQQSM